MNHLSAIIRGLGAIGLAVALAAGPADRAVALPRPPGDDNGPGQEETPPDDATDSDSIAISADSVVATVRILYNGQRQLAVVEWGDGATTVSCPPDGTGPVSAGCRPVPVPPEPAGVIELRHTYTPATSGAPFTAAITVRHGSMSRTVGLPITPRYRVTQSQAIFKPLVSDCDTSVELENEWWIKRTGGGLPDAPWRFDWIGDIGYPLVDSGFSVVGTAATLGRVEYEVVEQDLLFDDLGGSGWIDLAPGLGSRSVRLSYQQFSPGYTTPCLAEITADITVQIVEPAPHNGNQPGGGPVAHQ